MRTKTLVLAASLLLGPMACDDPPDAPDAGRDAGDAARNDAAADAATAPDAADAKTAADAGAADAPASSDGGEG